jgi:hypothetical protein
MLTAACHQLIYINQPRAAARRRDGSAPMPSKSNKAAQNAAFYP